MTPPAPIAKRIKAAIELANHPTTGESERQAAINGAWRMCVAAKLPPEDFGLYQPIDPDEESTALYYMDEGWMGSGWRPSQLFELGYLAIATADHLSEEQQILRGARYKREIIDAARRRWREGYFADPFTQEPRLRSVDSAKR